MNIDSIQVNQVFVEIEHHFDFPTASIGAIDFKRIEIGFGFKNNQAKLIQFRKELIFGIGSFFLSKGNITDLLLIGASGVTKCIEEAGIIYFDFFIEYRRFLIPIKDRCKRLQESVVFDFTGRLLEGNDKRKTIDFFEP